MKVVLLRPQSIFDATATAVSICPPIGLAYLNAIIKKYTRNVDIIDSIGNFPFLRTISQSDGKNYRLLGQTIDEIIDALPANFDLLFVSIMFSQDWPIVLSLIKKIKLLYPEIKIVAGGEHISALPDFSMNTSPEIDLCVIGEGELTLDEILSKYVKNNKLPSNCYGTYFRSKNGKIIINPRRPRILDLNTLSLPDWKGIPLETYLSAGHGFGVNLGRSMPILATRGCPYSCAFCSCHSMWGAKWISRSPE